MTSQKATKNFDYTTSNNSHHTGLVKPVYERSTFQLTATAVESKEHTFKKIVNNPPYRDWGQTANQSGEVDKIWYINIHV